MTSVTLNGNAYSDDGTTSRDMNAGGFRNYLLPMLGDAMTDIGAKQTAAQTARTGAEAAQSQAQAYANTALNGPGTTATTANSTALATGSKSWTIQTGKSIVPGMTVRLADSSTGASWFQGEVTAYNSGTGALTVNVTSITGTGTPANLSLSLAPSGGASLTTNNFVGAQNFAAGVTMDIPVTLWDLDAVTSNTIIVQNAPSSTAGQNGIKLAAGVSRTVIVLAANASSRLLASSANGWTLQLPGQMTSLALEAGDVLEFTGVGSNTVRVVNYVRKTGASLGVMYACFQERQNSGTSAGNSSAGVTSRALNTTVSNNIPGVAISSGTITISRQGVYLVRGSAPCYGGGAHQAKISGNAGDSALAGAGTMSRSSVAAVLTLDFNSATSLSFTLDHYIQNAVTNGLGLAVGSGVSEVYSQLEIWRIG